MDLREIADGLGISLASVKRYLATSLHSIQTAVARDEALLARFAALSPPNSAGGNR